MDSPGSQTFVSFDGTGHFTGVRVADPAHPGASLHSDTFTYGDSTNPDAMTTVSQGVGVSSSGYAKDTTSVDPFGVATPRLTSQTAGAAGGFNGADGSGDGTEQGTFRTSFGAMTDPNGPGSHTNTLTDARNNRTTQTFTLTGDIPSSFVSWGAIDSLTTTRPAYANAAAANSPNVTKTVYSPDMNHPTQVTVYDALWNRAPLNQKPSPWVSVYDGFDNLTSATDPLNHTWKNAYQNNLELTSTTDPTGVMWSFVYGESGAPSSRLTRIKDTTGTTRVQYGYNHFGQVNQTTIPAGASASHSAEITTIAYNEANGTGDVTGITSPLGTVTIGGYDPFGDAGSMTVYPDTGDPATSLKPLTAAVQYNAAQYVVGSTLANGVQTVNQWTNGIISGVQSYAPAPAGSAPGTLGALLTQIGFNYDSRGRLYKATDRTGNPTAQYRYDKNSNLTQIWDGLGQITKFSFGANNEPLGVKWPDNHTTTLNYDTPGRLSAATDERGVTSFYAYDVAHRLTDVTFDSGYQHEKVHRDYDEANRVLYVSDESGSRTYDYGPAGGLKRLSKIQTALASPFAPPLRYDVDYAYDPDGSVKMLVYRINGAVYTTSYVYNTAHQLQELDDPFGNVTKWTYDHAGRALTQTTTTTAQKTIRTAYTWGVSNFPGDPSTAPAYLQHIAETAAGTQAWDYELTHSYMGQVLGQTQTVSGTQTGAETYQYDPARGRLLSESQTAQTSVAASWNGAYQYDAANNVLPQNGTAAWTHNSSNQITSAPPAALSGGSGLTYDAAGSLKTFSGRSLYYDAFGRLSSAGAIYTYDAEGRRVSKTAGGATYFLYSGGMLLAEVNAFSGQVVRAYTWGALGLISDSADRPIDPANPAPSAFVTVSGKAILEGAGSFAAGMTLHCTLVSTRQNVSLITRDVTLDGSGAFSLPNVPADAYVLSVKADRWLRTNVPIDASGGDVTTITAWLSAGDADNDNSVDSSDFGILIGAMDTEADVPDSGYDVHADFNNDGFVDSNDFGLLIGNFNVTGAALPASFVAGTPLPAPDRFYLFDGLGNTRSVVDSGGNSATLKPSGLASGLGDYIASAVTEEDTVTDAVASTTIPYSFAYINQTQQICQAINQAIKQKAGFDSFGEPIILDSGVDPNGVRADGMRGLGGNVRSVSEIFINDPGDSAIKQLAEQVRARVITHDHGQNIGGGFGNLAIRIPPIRGGYSPATLMRLIK